MSETFICSICGFEIVTHPMTLEYHETVMPWFELLHSAVNMGYRSHQTSTCGLHVHVNRDSLGDTPAQQEDTIARILFFVENNWNELLKFSRRTVSQMQQWAARYGRKDSPKEVMETAKNKCYSRYSCVNLLNYSTIEFRMFRGTLRCSTLKATLQLVNEICNVAFSSSDEEMSDLTWVEFVARLDTKRCPELVNYLKERRLYVCEPVQGTFTFTVLDDRNNLYIVKGNNPMCIYHFPREGFYIYASTKEILDQATTKLRLNRRHQKEIPIKQGEILKIMPEGSHHIEQFQNDYLLQSSFNLYGWGGRYPYYPTYPTYPSKSPDEEQPSYLEELMEFGESIGVMREDQQLLLDAGYTRMDLEEMFYDPMMLDVCLRDAACPV